MRTVDGTPAPAPSRGAPPDLTVWLWGAGCILIAVGAIVLITAAGPSFTLDSWRWRVAPLLMALGILTMFSVYGLLVALRPTFVACGARLIVNSQTHPRGFALAIAWCGTVLAVVFFIMAMRPEAIRLVPGTASFTLACFAILAAGVVGVAPLALLRWFDRKRSG